MKYIKQFESLNKEKPEIGDYIQVIINGDDDESDIIFSKFINFVNNNIGKIISINNRFINDNEVRIKYDAVPIEIKTWLDHTEDNSIREYSKIFNLNAVDDYIIGKTQEEVRIKMQSNKYNL